MDPLKALALAIGFDDVEDAPPGALQAELDRMLDAIGADWEIDDAAREQMKWYL